MFIDRYQKEISKLRRSEIYRCVTHFRHKDISSSGAGLSLGPPAYKHFVPTGLLRDNKSYRLRTT